MTWLDDLVAWHAPIFFSPADESPRTISPADLRRLLRVARAAEAAVSLMDWRHTNGATQLQDHELDALRPALAEESR